MLRPGRAPELGEDPLVLLFTLGAAVPTEEDVLPNPVEGYGDDRLTGGRVSPESFTHGTSEQRARWLRQGLQTGDINSCDTFRSSTF